jgi:hypothetical protein
MHLSQLRATFSKLPDCSSPPTVLRGMRWIGRHCTSSGNLESFEREQRAIGLGFWFFLLLRQQRKAKYVQAWGRHE